MTAERQPAGRVELALACLRIGVGVFFIVFGQYKVLGTRFIFEGGFLGYINRWTQAGAYPFMKPVLTGFVVPHATFIAFLVAYGELAIGVALVLGVLVRTASAFGLLFMVTMLLCSAYPNQPAAFWQYFGASLNQSVFAMCFAAFLLAGEQEALTFRRWRQPTLR